MLNFPPESIRRYFETRLKDQRIPMKKGVVKCPFHDDSTASLSLDTEKGLWHCHACNVGGGLVGFEKAFSKCDDGDAWRTISEITGEKWSGKRPSKVYLYTDEFDRPLYRVLRAPDGSESKIQGQQKYLGNGKWAEKLLDARRVLYHLPDVITSNEVIVTEGEKDCDAVRSLDLSGDRSDLRITATTNSGGAGKWQSQYSGYLTGKRVLILSDNDDPGRAHAESVAKSVYPFAAGVKIINLPGLPEKGDVSDWLKTHTPQELIEEIRKAPVWKPVIEAVENDKFFVGAANFASEVPDAIDWAVKGIIPRGWNGFIIADPKSLKSFSAVNLMLHLALGQDWLGFKVPRRMKTALLAREDHSGLTAWRIKNFLRGMTATTNMNDLNEWMFVNSRAQEQSFFLDNDDDLARLIGNLKRREVEFVIMDVFRRLHFTDENDNKEMQGILERVSKIQNAVGCAIGIVHHANKGDGFIFNRTRGASVIHGWMEWGIGITTENKDDLPRNWVRKMEFLSKAAGEPDPVYVKSEGGESEGYLRLVVTQKPEKTKARKTITKDGNKEFWQD